MGRIINSSLFRRENLRMGRIEPAAQSHRQGLWTAPYIEDLSRTEEISCFDFLLCFHSDNNLSSGNNCMIFMLHFELKYHGNIPCNQVRRSLGQFTPAYWDKDQWNFLSGPIRFVQVMGLVIVILIVEVNAFYLKFILWIPPRNPLNSYRLLVWWIIANPAIREYNSFLQNKYVVPSQSTMPLLSSALATAGFNNFCFSVKRMDQNFLWFIWEIKSKLRVFGL